MTLQESEISLWKLCEHCYMLFGFFPLFFQSSHSDCLTVSRSKISRFSSVTFNSGKKSSLIFTENSILSDNIIFFTNETQR